jgi:hypothetical protein
MACIPPLPDPLGTGIPQCPDGYTYDPVQKLCCPNTPPPVNLQDPTIRALVTGMADREFDPAQAYKVGMQGVKDSGILERFVVALLRGGVRLLAPLIEEAASLVDDVLTVLAEVFQASQAQHASGYYRLAGALVTDLLGIETSGDQLYRDFSSGGRQAAMVALGGSIFDVLAAEFVGTAQTGTTGAFTVAKGTGVGGLPDATLTPTQGVNGAKALLGYASAFAIREGNSDLLASYLPYGIGEIFKDFAEDFSKNLGIGRMMRHVWKPLITTLVGTPMQQAMNLQYRPKLLDPGQAFRAWVQNVFSSDELTNELALAGYSAHRIASLQWQHLRGPGRVELRTINATTTPPWQDYAVWEARDGRTPDVTALLDQYDDVRVARDAVLRTAEHFASELLLGKIPSVQYQAAINSIAKTVTGQPMLTPGELTALLSLQGIAVAGTRKHLSVPQLFREYEDGLITLTEFSDHVAELGYSPDDVRLLEQELLISAQRAADRAAKAAAAAQRGKLAKLTIAQLETGYIEGILDLATIEAELAVRQYAPDAIAAIVAEFRTKAKLRPVTPPTA